LWAGLLASRPGICFSGVTALHWWQRKVSTRLTPYFSRSLPNAAFQPFSHQKHRAIFDFGFRISDLGGMDVMMNDQ
jgi:hypothetical protein